MNQCYMKKMLYEIIDNILRPFQAGFRKVETVWSKFTY